MKARGLFSSSALLLYFLVALVMFFAYVNPVFLSFSNASTILTQSAAAVVAAAGMTYVILLADIDLSVGSVMVLSTTVAITWFSSGSQFDTQTSAWVYPVGLTVGLMCGLMNAFLITRLKLNALIVTLGTMSIYQGMSLTITQAGTRVLDGAITLIGTARLFGIPVVVFVMIVVTVGATLFLKYRPNGRLIMAVGGDSRSARETGMSQGKARYIAFGFIGAMAGLAGLITAGQVGVTEANMGADFSFTVITAVVIGGTSLFGGRGTVVGSAIGAVLLVTIDAGLNLMNASIYAYDVVRGVLLVLAMLSDSSVRRFVADRALRSHQSKSAVPHVAYTTGAQSNK